jgi:quercetin dioxygenase-like cupin family protein
MWVGGESPQLAAENLLIRLRGNLDAVSDPSHREPVCDAIADVQEFLASDRILPPSSNNVIDALATVPNEMGTLSSLLAKTDMLEIRRLTLSKGRKIPTHQAAGEITVHCLEGRIAFTVGGKIHELGAGQLLVVAAGEPHSLEGLEDSTVLVTKMLPARPPAA